MRSHPHGGGQKKALNSNNRRFHEKKNMENKSNKVLTRFQFRPLCIYIARWKIGIYLQIAALTLLSFSQAYSNCFVYEHSLTKSLRDSKAPCPRRLPDEVCSETS